MLIVGLQKVFEHLAPGHGQVRHLHAAGGAPVQPGQDLHGQVPGDHLALGSEGADAQGEVQEDPLMVPAQFVQFLGDSPQPGVGNLFTPTG